MIKKGDQVKILAGKDRGKTAKVLRIVGDKVLVEGVNLFKKHERARHEGKKGQMIERAMPINTSNVALYCDKCKKGVRVGTSTDSNGKKTRICRSCKSNI